MKLKLFWLTTWALVTTEARLAAQTFTTLHSFTAAPGPSYINGDGAGPASRLILSSNTLYGTTYGGGSSRNGIVFAVNTDGTGFKTLHSFTATFGSEGVLGSGTNSDGASPEAGLILSGNTLYGTTSEGGSSGNGTIFAVNNDGTGFKNLHSFTATFGTAGVFGTNTDGAFPEDALILSGSDLYGTAAAGGSSGSGTVFVVNTNGMRFTNLYSFTATLGSEGFLASGTNSDGAYPEAGLILSGNTLYGTALYGGSSGEGTVFALDSDGAGFTTLYNFTGSDNNAHPYAGLIISGNTLYGTTSGLGHSGGTVFAVKTNGMDFKTVYIIPLASPPRYENGGGASPEAGLILSGDTLYGTTTEGGSSGNGTVFAVDTNGTVFSPLHIFTSSTGTEGVFGVGTNSDGVDPLYAGLILSGCTLYGTAFAGGVSGNGTVFSLSFPQPNLMIAASDTNVFLSWPVADAGFSYAGYTLQVTTNFGPLAAWSPVAPGPVVVAGQLAVTNPITDRQRFYRLSQ